MINAHLKLLISAIDLLKAESKAEPLTLKYKHGNPASSCMCCPGTYRWVRSEDHTGAQRWLHAQAVTFNYPLGTFDSKEEAVKALWAVGGMLIPGMHL